MSDDRIHQLSEDDVSGPSAAPGDENVVQVLPDLQRRYGAAFRRHSRGELIRWDLTFMPMPKEPVMPGEQPQLIAMLVLYIEVRGAVVRSAISGTRLMEMGGHTDEIIDKHVQEMVDGVLEARSQQLAQLEIDAKAAAQRGEEPPTAGLILGNGQANPTWDDAERAFQNFGGG